MTLLGGGFEQNDVRYLVESLFKYLQKFYFVVYEHNNKLFCNIKKFAPAGLVVHVTHLQCLFVIINEEHNSAAFIGVGLGWCNRGYLKLLHNTIRAPRHPQIGRQPGGCY